MRDTTQAMLHNLDLSALRSGIVSAPGDLSVDGYEIAVDDDRR